MTKFFTPYVNRPSTRPCASGSRFRDTYGETLDDDGQVIVAKTGKVDQYQMTQEAKPLDIYGILEQSGVDVNNIASQVEFDEEMITDFTSAPRTLAEAHMLMRKGEDSYMSLPIEVRDEFGSPAKFITSLQDGTFRDRLKKFLPVQPEKVVDHGQSEK